VNPAHMMKNRNTASFPAKLNLSHDLVIWFFFFRFCKL
jgi:hypothetical protein